jgi:23S rRNA pseudouridine1911/1915/1917 synthase
MIVVKTEEAMTSLSKQFYNHTIEREYQALVWGNFEQTKGTITRNIGRHETARYKMDVAEEGKGKHAITHYEVEEDLYYVSLVRCRLETGRTHQIRVHMQHTGHPLFGDWRYDGEKIWKGTIYSKYKRFVENCLEIMPRQALHARKLGFIHPATNKKMVFEQPLPEDFDKVLERWRNYVKSKSGM